MQTEKKNKLTAQCFIDETLALIQEKGSSRNVNLREISKRLGCAHTNAYNYFKSYHALLWAAFDEALKIYARDIIRGLSQEMSRHGYFTKLMHNMIGFSVQNPGLFRFINADPVDISTIPQSSLLILNQMKSYFVRVIHVLAQENISHSKAENIANILIAYMDGEMLAIINQRHFPNEDVLSRVKSNTELLFTQLTATQCNGIDLKSEDQSPGIFPFPVLEID